MRKDMLLLSVFGVCFGLFGAGAAYSARPDSVRGPTGPRGVRTCRCVPDQFETILVSLEREFDLFGGRSADHQSRLAVHYDYTNRKFASEESASGVKTIADYNRGLKYIVRRGGDCRRIVVDKDTMPRMCLPESSILAAEYRLSFDVPVTVWTATDQETNITMSTVVDMRNCLPVSEETYLVGPEYATTTHSTYANTSLGIEDKSVFDLPQRCLKVTDRRRQKFRKIYVESNHR